LQLTLTPRSNKNESWLQSRIVTGDILLSSVGKALRTVNQGRRVTANAPGVRWAVRKGGRLQPRSQSMPVRGLCSDTLGTRLGRLQLFLPELGGGLKLKNRDLTILGRQRDGNGYQYNRSLKIIE
jgi:hypothetical protein